MNENANKNTSSSHREANHSRSRKCTRWVGMIVNGLSSGKLTLALIAILMLMSLAGAMLPQAGQMTPDQIATWQEKNPIVTRILNPVGLFDVFICWPFLCTIVLLTINTLAGTITHFIQSGGFKSLIGPMACKRIGFVLLHLSILLLLTGGFYTAAYYFEGKIILTEGQQFIDARQPYLDIRKGLLQHNQPVGLAVKLQDVDIQYEQQYPVSVLSKLDIFSDHDQTISGNIEVNKPLVHQGYSITQDETGFSPRLSMRDARRGPILFHSYIGLKTFKTESGKQYRDYFPMTFHSHRFVITLYPSFKEENDQFLKNSDIPDKPMLLLEMENEAGLIVESTHIEIGQQAELGGYRFTFEDLRQWSKFRVRKDPGYLLVCIALWLALAAMILRYLPDLRNWFLEPSCSTVESGLRTNLKQPLPLAIDLDHRLP